ncbi:glycerol kinase GlpK [Candidatus Poribacteria bacterium]|nr:glycerol kinase GlpK [Candidatus Poribacteria bacterium]
MKERYILAIDQGTTGTTVLLIDKNGNIASKAYSEISQYYPKPGWVEHDPQEIWEKTLSTACEAVEASEIKANQIAGIGITNQRETAVVWDTKSDEPFHRAIVWQCRRTADMCRELRSKGLSEKIRAKTGLVIDPYFSATKVAWIMDNVENARKSEAVFGTVDSWLVWKLTGGKFHATDYTNASRTMLFNIHSLEWDDELLELMNIPSNMMPRVYASSASFGTVDCGCVLDGIPIAGIAGDQQAALFGQACFEVGSVKNTYGTGCFIMLNTGEKPVASNYGLLTTLACSVDDKPVYALEGSVFIAGAAVQWLRDEMGLIETASETEGIAETIGNADGVYMVPAFTGLGAPYWNSDARGAILGITRGTGKSHLVRAALESIAYQTADVIDAMRSDLGEDLLTLKADGGASANDFLMQFQSDILNIKVDRPVYNETTALGAAFLAGLEVGFWNSKSEIEACRKTDVIFNPKMDNKKRKELLSGWHKAVNQVISNS